MIEQLLKDKIIEKITKYLEDNVALFDCQGDCPEEVALNEELRTDRYCDRCFAGQIFLLLKEAGVELKASSCSPPQ